jgi:integrase/recombinase XerC
VLDQDIQRHLEHLRLRGLSRDTIYGRQRALARMAALLPVPLLEATPGHLYAWRARLDISDGGIGHYVSHAQQFYAWAAAEGLITGDPAAGLPRPRLGRMLPRPISEADLLEVLDAAPRRIRPWLVLAAWAGLRAKEIALLKVECVLVAARPPVILVATDATKGRTERIVPASAFVVAELAAACLPARGYAFRRMDGQPGANSPWVISKLANDHLHDCGYPETLHQLRHRFGTMVYRVRRDLRSTQELMGHSSPSTTAGYAAYDREEAVDDVEALPAPL